MRFRYHLLTLILALLGMVVIPTQSHAQVIAGTSLSFDHTAEEQTYVQSYQLCVGPVTGTSDCRDIVVTRAGTTPTLTFTLPSWAPGGNQTLSVRAVWKAPLTGNSGPSNTLSQVVVGAPTRFRTTTTATP